VGGIFTEAKGSSQTVGPAGVDTGEGQGGSALPFFPQVLAHKHFSRKGTQPEKTKEEVGRGGQRTNPSNGSGFLIQAERNGTKHRAGKFHKQKKTAAKGKSYHKPNRGNTHIFKTLTSTSQTRKKFVTRILCNAEKQGAIESSNLIFH